MNPLSIRNRQANALLVTNRTDDVICDVIDDISGNKISDFQEFQVTYRFSYVDFLAQIDVNDKNIDFPDNLRIR